MITDIQPFFEGNARIKGAEKRARKLAKLKGLPEDQFVFTQLTVVARESGSPKLRDRITETLADITAKLVDSPLIVIDPDPEADENEKVKAYRVIAAQGTSVRFEGEDEWFDLADFPFEWRLFDPALTELANL